MTNRGLSCPRRSRHVASAWLQAEASEWRLRVAFGDEIREDAKRAIGARRMHVDLVDFLVDTDAHRRHLQATEEARLATNVQRLGEDKSTLDDFEVRALSQLLAIDEHQQRTISVVRQQHATAGGNVITHTRIVRRFSRRGSK